MAQYEFLRKITETPKSAGEILHTATGNTEEDHDDVKQLMISLLAATLEGSMQKFWLVWPKILKQADLAASAESKGEISRRISISSSRAADHIQRFWVYQSALEASFAVAMAWGHRQIAQKILCHFKHPSYGCKLKRTIPHAWEEFRCQALNAILPTAASYGDVAVVSEILKGEDCIRVRTLGVSMNCASRWDGFDKVEPLVEHLMAMKKGDPKISWGAADTTRDATLDEQRLDTVGFAFSLWPSRTKIHGIRMILVLFFQLVHAVYAVTPDCEECPMIHRAIEEQWALALSRDQCFKLLDKGLPPQVRASLFHSLRVVDRSMPPDTILIKTVGEPVAAQKDLLCYWSKYFVGLTRHGWTDSGAVDFGYHIHPEVMSSVLDFMYCGEYLDVECFYKKEFLTQLWEAADYLLIDQLKEKVGLVLTELEEEEEEL